MRLYLQHRCIDLALNLSLNQPQDWPVFNTTKATLILHILIFL